MSYDSTCENNLSHCTNVGEASILYVCMCATLVLDTHSYLNSFLCPSHPPPTPTCQNPAPSSLHINDPEIWPLCSFPAPFHAFLIALLDWMPLFWPPCLQAPLSNLFPKRQPEWSSHTGLRPCYSPAQMLLIAPHCLPHQAHLLPFSASLPDHH